MTFSRTDLHPYQERAVDFIKEHPRCALWVDMGLGKTVSTLTAIADLMAEFEAWRALVIAPLRVARTTWPEEAARWDHVRLPVRVIAGSPEQRKRIVEIDESPIHVINRELVTWLAEAARPLPYDLFVIDEASSFKDPSTKRFKALRRAIPERARVVELTGTPAPNGLLGLWSQLFLLDRGERLGRTFSQYRERHFQCGYSGYDWSPREGEDRKIHDRVKDLCLTLSAEDYLDLPDRVDATTTVEIPAGARAQYGRLERELLLQLENGTAEAANAAVLTGKLLQFANGALYTENGWEAVHDEKLDALEEILEAANGPVLIAYNFRFDLERLRARFPAAEPIGKDPATIARWNRGEIPLMLAHPASAGHGLNLQAGGATVVWFGLNWSLELYQQFNARLHRQGQTKPVIVHHIVAKDTIDETVIRALSGKHQTQKALLDAVRTDIGARRNTAPKEENQ